MKRKTFLIVNALLLALIAAPAYAELVIVINPKNATSTMQPSQAAQFFLGGSVTFIPLEQAENSPLRSEFYKKVLEKEPSQVQAIWSRIVFTGKGSPPKTFKSSNEVKKAISDNVNAIGYIEKSAVDDSVKVVTIVP